MNQSSQNIKRSTRKKIIVKKCHVCGHVNEATHELEKCQECRKSFLPSHYFKKIHDQEEELYNTLFNDAEEIDEELLIKGLYVIW